MIRNDSAFRRSALNRSSLFAAALIGAFLSGPQLAGAQLPPPPGPASTRAMLACAAGLERIGFAGRDEAVFTVEIAADAESQNRGLMWRESLAPEAGMLFIFTPPRPSQFWMKNTLIPLDIIFFDLQGRVQHIEREAVPGDLSPRGPAAVSSAVLEIAGGRAAELGLELGDRAICPEG